MSLADYESIFRGQASTMKSMAKEKVRSGGTRGMDAEEASTTSAEHSEDKSEPQSTARKMIIQLVDITQRETSYGDRPVVTLTDKYHQAKEDDEKFAEYALVIRRRIDRHRESIGVTLEVQSDIIRKGIQDVFGEYPSVNLLSSPIVFSEPYYPLFHFKEGLEAYASAVDRTEEEKEHMLVLTKFMKENLAKAIRQYESMVPNGYISYDYLQYLFRPCQLVVSLHDELKECFYIIASGERSNSSNDERLLQFVGLCWKYDGKTFGPCYEILKIPQFSGVRKILQLELVPLNLIAPKAQAELRQSLISRGKRWRALVDVSHCEYNGTIWTPSTDESGNAKLKHVTGRVILDHKTYNQENPHKRVLLQRTGQLIDIENDITEDSENTEGINFEALKLQDDDEGRIKLRKDQVYEDISKRYLNRPGYNISDTQALLCPARLPGFALAEKSWGHFHIDHIAPIKWNTGAFDQLEFDPAKKQLIRTLVGIHQRAHSTFDDIIVGKGKGLIFSLHGPPGGGKTLTAECIAEYARLPLFCVTSGDLGTDPENADSELQTIFSIAKAWNAIVLLDEADVFLARRKSDDITRNAFVTIFLRTLEWFQGILFLTSNRPEEFDEAFRSRIHMTMYYPPLDEQRRANVWRNLLRSGERIPGGWEDDEEVFGRLGGRYELNGREIKNLISTAMAVCIESGCLLSEEVIEMVHGMNEAGRKLGVEKAG